jgi:hypothetical protein
MNWNKKQKEEKDFEIVGAWVTNPTSRKTF